MTAHECRLKAAHCERMAGGMGDEVVRRSLREAAEQWRSLARAAEAIERSAIVPVSQGPLEPAGSP